jgi:hypothetical protein
MELPEERLEDPVQAPSRTVLANLVKWRHDHRDFIVSFGGVDSKMPFRWSAIYEIQDLMYGRRTGGVQMGDLYFTREYNDTIVRYRGRNNLNYIMGPRGVDALIELLERPT